jgi:hypothetical protein
LIVAVLFWLIDQLPPLGNLNVILKFALVIVALIAALMRFGPMIGLH